MSTASSKTSRKCLVCYCTFRSERTKNSEQFTNIFDTFLRLLKISLIHSMQWNFEQDFIPFCEFCCSEVEKLYGIYDQIELLQQQMKNILNRIKHEMQISESEPAVTNELPSDDRVNYFRHLVIGGTPIEDDFKANTEVISLNVGTIIEVATHLDTQNTTELSLPQSMDEPCEFDDVHRQITDIECDPLLTVKRESDCSVDVESFPLHNLESVAASIFLEPSTASSIPVLDCVNETIKKEDLEGQHRCQFCEETFWTKLSMELHLQQHLDKNKSKGEKCNESFLSKNDLTANHHKQVHGIQLPKNSDIVENERRLVIKLTRCDLPLSGNKPEVKLDKKKTFCKVCDKGDASSEEFSKFHSLTCYKRIHTGEMKYKCDYCDKRYGVRYLLVKHRRSHTGEKLFKCGICNKLFSRLGGLKTHKIMHSAHKPFKCEICGKRFRESGVLRKHMLIHKGEKPHQCGVCLKKFRHLGTLNVHKRIHTGEKPFTCDLCNKSFTNQSGLKNHKRLHSDGIPCKCEFCDKPFRDKLFLKKHMKIHMGENGKKCEICSKTFSHPRTLITHRRMHTGVQPFKCEFCTKSFKSSGALSIHKRLHTGERPFKCKVCNKAFTSSSVLRKHGGVHAEKRFICELCNKSFIYSTGLARHKRLHRDGIPSKCHVCNEPFRDSVCLQIHMKTHKADIPNKCEICLKTFPCPSKLIIHKRIHTGEKPFKCD